MRMMDKIKPKPTAPTSSKELPVLKRFTPGDLQVMFQLHGISKDDEHYCSSPVVSLWPQAGWTAQEAEMLYGELLADFELSIDKARHLEIIVTSAHRKIATVGRIYTAVFSNDASYMYEAFKQIWEELDALKKRYWRTA